MRPLRLVFLDDKGKIVEPTKGERGLFMRTLLFSWSQSARVARATHYSDAERDRSAHRTAALAELLGKLGVDDIEAAWRGGVAKSRSSYDSRHPDFEPGTRPGTRAEAMRPPRDAEVLPTETGDAWRVWAERQGK